MTFLSDDASCLSYDIYVMQSVSQRVYLTKKFKIQNVAEDVRSYGSKVIK